MKLRSAVLLVASHCVALGVGFAVGLYTLPIITAPDAPTTTALSAVAQDAQYTAEFHRDLQDSDALHWGEGKLFIARDSISFKGRLAPGPDYRLYLSPTFVETEVEFERQKATMVAVGNIRTFENFLVEVPADIDPADYTTAIVWCESFGEFITAARYRDIET